jgi:hypothetical protein
MLKYMKLFFNTVPFFVWLIFIVLIGYLTWSDNTIATNANMYGLILIFATIKYVKPILALPTSRKELSLGIVTTTIVISTILSNISLFILLALNDFNLETLKSAKYIYSICLIGFSVIIVAGFAINRFETKTKYILHGLLEVIPAGAISLGLAILIGKLILEPMGISYSQGVILAYLFTILCGIYSYYSIHHKLKNQDF